VENLSNVRSVDDDLDKLGDALDTGKELSGVKTGSKSQSQIPEVMWEFKWKNEDDAPTYGPYSSEDMLKWTEDGLDVHLLLLFMYLRTYVYRCMCTYACVHTYAYFLYFL
jgi:hypothetical protein